MLTTLRSWCGLLRHNLLLNRLRLLLLLLEATTEVDQVVVLFEIVRLAQIVDHYLLLVSICTLIIVVGGGPMSSANISADLLLWLLGQADFVRIVRVGSDTMDV